MRRIWYNPLFYKEVAAKVWEVWLIGILCFLLGVAVATMICLAVN